MSTKSDRNLSYHEAVAAGLVAADTAPFNMLKRASDWPDTTQFPGVPRIDSAPVTPKSIQLLDTEAVKADDGKVDWSLVPFEALEGMVQVLQFGAKKYDSWNWTKGGGFVWMRVFASCMRHLFAWSRGEDNDPESGMSHISHAQCNLLFLAYYIRNKDKFNKDNRNVR